MTPLRVGLALAGPPALLLGLAVAACDSSPGTSNAGVPTPTVTRYPAAPWRLLPWSKRAEIVAWVSHIVISHRDASPDMALRPMGWAPDQAPGRSRKEAEQLALRVDREAQEHPERFEALAREYSDDSVTRSLGGSLGGITITQLPPEYVDALTALMPGEVSQVIPTGMGYHIVLHRSPPPRENVAGRRVVIRYAGTINPLGDGSQGRSREQALTLAKDVVDQTRSGRTPFTELAEKSSDHGDRVYQGDLGVWSTVAPGDHPREVEMLSRIKIGEVSDPLDSVWGFQVLERILPVSHDRYAMAAIRFKDAPGAPPEDPKSRASVAEEARSVAARLRKDPSAFSSLQEQHHSTGAESWEFGHGSAEITAALDKVQFGEVPAEPVEQVPFFVVPLRLDPALVTVDAPHPSNDLPLRVAPDVEGVFRDADSGALLKQLEPFTRSELAAALHLTDAERATLRTAIDALRKDLSSGKTADDRVQAYDAALKRIYDGMSAASYSRFVGFMEREVARILLPAP